MVTNAVVIAVITGLLEMIKPFIRDTRKVPFISLALGVIAGFFMNGELEIFERVISGIILGLAPVGLYETTFDKIKETE